MTKVLRKIESLFYCLFVENWNPIETWLGAMAFGFALLIPLFYPIGPVSFLLPLILLWSLLGLSRCFGNPFTNIILFIQKRE